MPKKHKQLFLVILAFLITGACIALLESPQVIGAMAGAFLTVVGAYTALDLRAVVRNTEALPSGTYARTNKWKYYVGILLLTLLFALCVTKQQLYELNLDLAYGMLGPGAIGIIGFVVAGMKMNKAATMSDGPEPSSEAVGTTDV